MVDQIFGSENIHNTVLKLNALDIWETRVTGIEEDVNLGVCEFNVFDTLGFRNCSRCLGWLIDLTLRWLVCLKLLVWVWTNYAFGTGEALSNRVSKDLSNTAKKNNLRDSISIGIDP
jgi:hypothetical protein